MEITKSIRLKIQGGTNIELCCQKASSVELDINWA